MYRFQQSIQNRQNTYTMEHEKGGGFLLGWKVFPLSKRLYLSLRDGFMRCKGTKNAIKSIICRIKNAPHSFDLCAFV